MIQLYVMVPGNPQPQLMKVDEAVEQIRSGKLPDTADVVRAGESKWIPAKELPEIKEKLALAPPPPPPPPAAAAPVPPPPSDLAGNTPLPAVTVMGTPPPDAFASQAGGTIPMVGGLGGAPTPLPANTPLPTVAGAPLVPQPAPFMHAPVGASKPLPKGILIGAIAATAFLAIGAVFLMFYRNSYSRGLVLEHVPEDCAELVYVDVGGIAGSDPVKQYLEKGLKSGKESLFDTFKSHKDKDRIEDAMNALKKSGIDQTTIREIAVCIRPNEETKKPASLEENGIILVGGTFRKADPLDAIKGALEAATGKDDLCKIEDDDIKLLKCSIDKGDKRAPIYAGLVDGRVLAISADKKLIKSVRTSKNVAKAYGADRGEHFVFFTSKDAMSYDGTYGDIKLKVGSNDTILAVETYYDAEKGKAKLAEIKDPDAWVKKKEAAFKIAAKTCFTTAPDYDMLADAIEGAKVEAFEDGAKYELRIANKDLGKFMKELSDVDLKELDVVGRLFSCVVRGIEPPASSYAYPPPGGFNE